MPADPPALTDTAELSQWFCGPPPPERQDLVSVAQHSQYGAWLLAFGRRVNHFTAAVDDVAHWQAHMIAAGVAMKTDIEGDVDGPLRQTASLAAPISVWCSDGSTHTMPYAYFEFAQRRPGFDGFLGQQARQLFDMTKG